MILTVDLETFSPQDIGKVGAYRYAQDPDFEILLASSMVDDAPVELIDLCDWHPLNYSLWDILKEKLFDPRYTKRAWNASFEWWCLSEAFHLTQQQREDWLEQWEDSMVHAMYCGLPASLKDAGKALQLPDDKAKMREGAALIRYFCCPCKPTKANGGRIRNLPDHDPAKWQIFRQYNIRDVETERHIDHILEPFKVPDFIWRQWRDDVRMNSRGIATDHELTSGALWCGAQYSAELYQEAKQITNLDNPNSPAQLLGWLESNGTKLQNLQKATVAEALKAPQPANVRRILELRQALGKSSLKKYDAIQAATGPDGRIRGTLQFYGATRTGRWAGRLLQVQNLPRTYLMHQGEVRELIKAKNLTALEMIYGDVSDVLSQMIRTALIPAPGKVFIDADFSAIEARLIAWEAGEDWVLDVFRTTGKIYETTAAKMFGIPVETIVKGNPNYRYRQRGKVATLALGYQGGVGAMRRMDALRSVGSLGAKAFGAIQRAVQSVRNRLTQSAKTLARFHNRLMSLVSGALIFNLISAGLRKMTEGMGSAMLSSASLRAALGNLEGAAMTAAAPLIQALTPALTAIANAAATALYYVAKLISFLTGKSIGASQGAAKAMGKYAKAAKSAGKEANSTLAKFDEIDRLDNKNSGGSSAITPNYDFSGENPLLDEVLQAIEAGAWFQVGRLIGEKLRDSLNAIPWPDIQSRAVQWATNIADTINGAVTTPGLWEAIGHTLAQGLNTATGFVDTFFQGTWWADIGAGLAQGLTQLVAEVNWEQLGRVLTDGLRAALLVLHGFVTTYTGWAELGLSIASMIGAALSNIDWAQAAGDLSRLAVGILTAINTGLAQIDWATVGQTVLAMISAIDWAGLFEQLGQLFATLWPLILAAVVLPAIISWIGKSLMTALTNSLIPALTVWLTTTVIPAISAGLTAISGFLIATIAGWPVLLIAALVIVAAAILAFLISNWDSIVAWFAGVWANFVTAWNNFWGGLASAVADIWNGITTAWRDFWTGIFDKFNALRIMLGNAWNSFWSGLATGVANIWNGIVSTVKGAVNSLIGFINGMLSGIVDGLNGAIDVLNKLSIDVPDWVPVVGGNHLGFNVSHITAPQIPYLAQGAVIPANREFLAVLGDQSHGTNVEAPLDTIKQAVAEVMEDLQAGQMAGFEAVVGVLREILSAVYGIELTDEDVGRAVQRWQRKQAIATGGV